MAPIAKTTPQPVVYSTANKRISKLEIAVVALCIAELVTIAILGSTIHWHRVCNTAGQVVGYELSDSDKFKLLSVFLIPILTCAGAAAFIWAGPLECGGESRTRREQSKIEPTEPPNYSTEGSINLGL